MDEKWYRIEKSKCPQNLNNELYHHGIKGQRWGVRRGPPYPLGTSQKSQDSPQETPRLRDRFVRVNETPEQSLQNSNSYKGTLDGNNNCSSCAVAGFMRQSGYDATAKIVEPPYPMFLDEVLKPAFPNAKIKSRTAAVFGKSPEDAANVLKKLYKEDASGVIGYMRPNGDGHVFNWDIIDGNVRFSDHQNGLNDVEVRKTLWGTFISPEGSIEVAKLKRGDFNDEELVKIVDIKMKA